MTSDLPPSYTDVPALLENGPYVALWPLGRGSMGEVWAIRHQFIGREFALKVLHRRHLKNSQLIERLKLEARAMAALEHPNIVDVTDFWISADGRPCLVMELLDGLRLDRELLRRKRLPGSDVLEIGRQALSALAAAHEIGLVHRDIKPENLFLHELPTGQRMVKLLDFGLARVLGGSATALTPLELTRTGTIFGTPRFMSPEALRGERIGPEADVYSMGVVLYVCLVGMHSPFDIATLPVFQSPSLCGAVGCSPRLEAAVLRAVEEEPGRRYSSAREFLAELDAIASTYRHVGHGAPD